MSSSPEPAKAAGVNLIATGISKFLTFFALSVLSAYYFGASSHTDAYVMGGLIPLWILSMLLYGLNAAFLPIFTEYRIKVGDEEAWQIACSFGIILIAVVSVIVIVGIIAAARIVPLYSAGFDSQTTYLAICLARWIYLVLPIGALAGLLSSIFYSYRMFVVPAIGNIISASTLVLALVIFNRTFDVLSLVIGLIGGNTLQLIWEAVWLYSGLGSNYALQVDWKHPGIRRIGSLLLPIAIGASTYSIYLFISRALASTLPEGSVTAIEYATKIADGLSMTVVAGVSTVFLPTFSISVTENKIQDLKETMALGIRMLSLFLAPLALGILALRVPLIRFLLQRGAFDSYDTETTAWALGFLILAILTQPFNGILVQMFFALQDTYRLLLGTTTGLVVAILTALSCIRYLGVGGLTLSISLGYLAQMVALFWMLRRRMGDLGEESLIRHYLKTLLAASIMGIITSVIWSHWGNRLPSEDTTGRLIRLQLTMLAGAVIYLMAGILIGVKELRDTWKVMQRNILSKLKASSDGHSL